MKANLSVVSHDEWAAIPDIGDYTVKHKNRKLEANAPVPESILGMFSPSCVLFVGWGRRMERVVT